MSQSAGSGGARDSPLPPEGIAAKRPLRQARPDLLAARAHQVAAGVEPVEIREGTLIGDYSVLRRLDEGGMGTVYAAVHPVIGKTVAIKVLHPHVARQEEAVARFIQEARAVNAIGHPGIVDIFGFGRFVDGRHYIIMEYLEGQQLLAYLNERGPIPPLGMLPVARQLAESLAAAHDKGVVHRDMKPENVFLGVTSGSKEPQPWPPSTKILDFGLAKLFEVGGADRKPRTRAGVTVGTPYYMSPEQCRGKAIDRRADVYALGVMMYEMVTGRVPFYAAESVDVLYMHLTQEPEAPSSHRPVDPEIEALILRCMSKQPSDRPQTMRELVGELDALTELLDPSEPPGDRPEHELVQEAEAFFGVTGEHEVVHPSSAEEGRAGAQTLRLEAQDVVVPLRPSTSDVTQAPAGAQAQAPVDPSRGSPEGEAAVGGSGPRSRPRMSLEPGSEVGDGPRDSLLATSSELGLAAPKDAISGQADSAEVAEPLGASAGEPLRASSPEGASKTSGPGPGSAPSLVDTLEITAKTAAISLPHGRVGARERALWVAVALLGVAVVGLSAMLAMGSSASGGEAVGAQPQGSRAQGSVEVRSPIAVDVLLHGRVVARGVRRILVTGLPVGSTQRFLLRRPDGSEHSATVRVASSRTVSVTVPPTP